MTLRLTHNPVTFSSLRGEDKDGALFSVDSALVPVRNDPLMKL